MRKRTAPQRRSSPYSRTEVAGERSCMTNARGYGDSDRAPRDRTLNRAARPRGSPFDGSASPTASPRLSRPPCGRRRIGCPCRSVRWHVVWCPRAPHARQESEQDRTRRRSPRVHFLLAGPEAPPASSVVDADHRSECGAIVGDRTSREALRHPARVPASRSAWERVSRRLRRRASPGQAIGETRFG